MVQIHKKEKEKNRAVSQDLVWRNVGREQVLEYRQSCGPHRHRLLLLLLLRGYHHQLVFVDTATWYDCAPDPSLPPQSRPVLHAWRAMASIPGITSLLFRKVGQKLQAYCAAARTRSCKVWRRSAASGGREGEEPAKFRYLLAKWTDAHSLFFAHTFLKDSHWSESATSNTLRSSWASLTGTTSASDSLSTAFKWNGGGLLYICSIQSQESVHYPSIAAETKTPSQPSGL